MGSAVGTSIEQEILPILSQVAMSKVSPKLYETLCLPPFSSVQEVRTAYRTLALKYHPDKNIGNTNAVEKFKEVKEAYEFLSDEEKKKKYDVLLKVHVRLTTDYSTAKSNTSKYGYFSAGMRPGGGVGQKNTAGNPLPKRTTSSSMPPKQASPKPSNRRNVGSDVHPASATNRTFQKSRTATSNQRSSSAQPDVEAFAPYSRTANLPAEARLRRFNAAKEEAQRREEERKRQAEREREKQRWVQEEEQKKRERDNEELNRKEQEVKQAKAAEREQQKINQQLRSEELIQAWKEHQEKSEFHGRRGATSRRRRDYSVSSVHSNQSETRSRRSSLRPKESFPLPSSAFTRSSPVTGPTRGSESELNGDSISSLGGHFPRRAYSPIISGSSFTQFESAMSKTDRIAGSQSRLETPRNVLSGKNNVPEWYTPRSVKSDEPLHTVRQVNSSSFYAPKKAAYSAAPSSPSTPVRVPNADGSTTIRSSRAEKSEKRRRSREKPLKAPKMCEGDKEVLKVHLESLRNSHQPHENSQGLGSSSDEIKELNSSASGVIPNQFTRATMGNDEALNNKGRERAMYLLKKTESLVKPQRIPRRSNPTPPPLSFEEELKQLEDDERAERVQMIEKEAENGFRRMQRCFPKIYDDAHIPASKVQERRPSIHPLPKESEKKNFEELLSKLQEKEASDRFLIEDLRTMQVNDLLIRVRELFRRELLKENEYNERRILADKFYSSFYTAEALTIKRTLKPSSMSKENVRNPSHMHDPSGSEPLQSKPQNVLSGNEKESSKARSADSTSDVFHQTSFKEKIGAHEPKTMPTTRPLSAPQDASAKAKPCISLAAQLASQARYATPPQVFSAEYRDRAKVQEDEAKSMIEIIKQNAARKHALYNKEKEEAVAFAVAVAKAEFAHLQGSN